MHEPLPSPNAIKAQIPLSPQHRDFIAHSRNQIKDILAGNDPRLLLIVGPCSIHDVNGAIEYAEKLKALASELEDSLYIVMRCYFEKPRTVYGWKGHLLDPKLDGSHNIAEGLASSRKLLRSIIDIGLPTGTEFVDPLATPYLADFISWGSIGARTSQSQIHRQIASQLPMPVGFKNAIDGNIEIAIQSAQSAAYRHHFLGICPDGKIAAQVGLGNPFPHIILRGGIDGPNYHTSTIELAKKKLIEIGLFPSLIIDCSHDNSKKNHLEQKNVLFSVLDNLIQGSSIIRGVMLESYHLAANQQQLAKALGRILTSDEEKNCSLTDPCLDWNSTESILFDMAAILRQKRDLSSRQQQSLQGISS